MLLRRLTSAAPRRAIAAVLLCVCAAFGVGGGASAANPPSIVVSHAAAHSLIARVADGVATPRLLVEPGASPHFYALSPSKAAELFAADLVFWIGPELEPWLARILAAKDATSAAIALGAAEGLTVWPARPSGLFATSAAVAPAAAARVDPHYWLDPTNAALWADHAAAALSAKDPANAARYAANAAALTAELTALRAEIAAAVAPVSATPFIVFHDAYQYFEHQFSLTNIGALSASDAARPGPARIARLRQALTDHGVACVFTEPQFQPKLAALIAGDVARLGMLDPVGADLPRGPDFYSALLRRLAQDLLACLQS